MILLWFDTQVGGDSTSGSEAEDSDSEQEGDGEEVYGVTSAISLTYHKVRAQDLSV